MAFGAEVAEAFVRIRPKTDGFKEDVQKQVQDPLKDIEKLGAKILGGAALFKMFGDGLNELKQQQQVVAQTAAVIKSTGGVAGVSAEHVADLSNSLQDLSGKDAEAITAGQNLMLTFRDVRNEAGKGNDIYDRATKAALDLSVAFSQDLTSSSIMVGKALEDPIAGVTALRRVGVQLTDAEKDQIKAFMDAGDVMSAQKIILGELETQVGGSAAAYGQTLPGKLERAKNAFDDLKASIVGLGAGPLERAATFGGQAATVFAQLPEPVQSAAVAMTALAIAGPKVTAMASAVVDKLVAFRIEVMASEAPMTKFTSGLAGMAKAGVVVAGLAQITSAINAIHEAQDKPGKDLASSLPDPADVDAYVDAVNRAVARQNELQEQIRALGTGGLSNAPEKLAGAWNVFTSAVTGSANGVVGLDAEFDGLNASLPPLIAHAKALVDRVNAIAGATGASGDDVKAFIAKFSGLDVAQVPLDKLVAAFNAARVPGADLARIAADLGVKVRTAATDAEDAAARFTKMHDAMFGLIDAQRGVADASERITEAQHAEQQASRQVADAKDSLSAATRRVQDAQASYEQSLRGVLSAQQAVADAERALSAARGGSADDELRRREADLRVRQAARALQQANAADGTDPEEKALRIEEAGLSLERARMDQRQLEEDIAKRVTDAEDNLTSAQQRLADAQRSAQQAAQGITDAQKGVESAARAVADADYAAGKAHAEVDKARWDAVKASDALAGKQNEVNDLMAQGALNIGGMIWYMATLANTSPDVAKALQPYLDQLRAIKAAQDAIKPPEELTPGGGSTTPEPVSGQAHRATGGPVKAGVAYRVGEHGEETFIPGADGRVVPHGQGVGTTIYQTNYFEGVPPDMALESANRRLSLLTGGW